jgi:hypothetical protein
MNAALQHFEVSDVLAWHVKVGKLKPATWAGRPGRDHARKLVATSVCAHPDRSGMAEQLEPLPSVGDSRLSKSDSNIDVPLALPVRAAAITSAR